MGAASKIEWTWIRVPIGQLTPAQLQLALDIGAMLLPPGDFLLIPGYTFNPWIGCTKVDELCAHCYAEELDARRFSKTMDGGTKANPVSHWGPGKPRHRTSAANWRQMRAWNDLAGALGVRQRVFCASLADWLDDDQVPLEWFADLLDVIQACQNLDILCLSKRPQNWRPRLEAIWNGVFQCATRWFARDWLEGNAPANVWLGTSVGHQKSANARIPELLKIPSRVHFLSCEPMLGPVDLTRIVLNPKERPQPDVSFDCLKGWLGGAEPGRTAVDWVICGGESGDDARPMHPDWVSHVPDPTDSDDPGPGLLQQCQAAGVPFLFKQWGEWLPDDQRGFRTSGDITWGLVHADGKFRLCVERGKRIPGSDVTWLKGEAGTTRVGKAKAARLLDRIEHNGSPEVTHA